ncbi:MAG: Holliday junction resolvase-like protein, partial [Brevinematia bacterium]
VTSNGNPSAFQRAGGFSIFTKAAIRCNPHAFLWVGIFRKERKMALNFSRSVIKGKVSEQILPLTPFFNYKLSDARFLGSPVDYIVFDGYSDAYQTNTIKEIIFIEVKTGKSQLSQIELAVKDAIDNGRVRYEVIYLQLDSKRN